MNVTAYPGVCLVLGLHLCWPFLLYQGLKILRVLGQCDLRPEVPHKGQRTKLLTDGWGVASATVTASSDNYPVLRPPEATFPQLGLLSEDREGGKKPSGRC